MAGITPKTTKKTAAQISTTVLDCYIKKQLTLLRFLLAFARGLTGGIIVLRRTISVVVGYRRAVVVGGLCCRLLFTFARRRCLSHGQRGREERERDDKQKFFHSLSFFIILQY